MKNKLIQVKKSQVIKFSKKLNTTNLSALRSGKISVRAKERCVEGFYITPSGMKYTSLKIKDIVFVSLKGIFDKKKSKPSSEWRFHQDIYVNKKEAQAIVLHIQHALQLSHLIKKTFQHFTIWLQ